MRVHVPHFWNGPNFRSMLLGTAFAISAGCASSYHASWQAENPDWVDTFPDSGSGLHETLAGVTAPRRFDDKLMVSKLDVLRLQDGAARILSDAEVDAAIAEGGSGTYGIVANLGCISEVDLQTYRGEKIGWALLIDGKLRAWDLPEYGGRCVVGNNFVPATLQDADLEGLVTAHRDQNFPTGMEHVGEWYAKGLAYLGAQRLADAENALARGDEIVDVGGGGRRPSVRGDTGRIRTTSESQIERARQYLTAGIAAKKAKSAEDAGESPPVAAPTPAPTP